MPDTTTTESPSRAGGLLALLGGIAVVISAFIDWGRPEVNDRSGFDVAIRVRGGIVAIIAGIALIALGLLLILLRARGPRVAMAIVTIVVALAAAGFALLFVVGDSAYRTAWASGCVDNDLCKGISSGQLKKRLDRAIEQKDVDFTPRRQVGVYVALAGGVVALIGGILGLRRGKRAAPAGGALPPAAQGSQPAAPPLVAPPPGTGPPPVAPPPASGPPPGPPPPQQPPQGGGFTP